MYWQEAIDIYIARLQHSQMEVIPDLRATLVRIMLPLVQIKCIGIKAALKTEVAFMYWLLNLLSVCTTLCW